MDDTLVSAAHGLRSHHPEEACTHHYFETKTTHLLVAETTSSPCPFSGSWYDPCYSYLDLCKDHHDLSNKEINSTPCPFSGSYTVQGRLLLGEEEDGCHTVMQVGSGEPCCPNFDSKIETTFTLA